MSNKGRYPKAIYFRNTKPDRRVCCNCGNKIRSRGSFMIVALAPGKYLCHSCDRKRDSAKKPTETNQAQSTLQKPQIQELSIPHAVQMVEDNYTILHTPGMKDKYPHLYAEVLQHDKESRSSWYDLSEEAYQEYLQWNPECE